MSEDVFIKCGWSCDKCCQRGKVSVWNRPGEQNSITAIRHLRETREMCVAGCLYKAWPAADAERKAS